MASTWLMRATSCQVLAREASAQMQLASIPIPSKRDWTREERKKSKKEN
jgi:hypothetical protein